MPSKLTIVKWAMLSHIELASDGGSSVDSLMAASSGCTRVNSRDEQEKTYYGVEPQK